MKRCTMLILAVGAFAFIFFSSSLSAQAANDQYGFSNRAFLIQSALEVSKSAKGFWDVPGKPGDAGNFKRPKKDWSEMGIWEREKGDPNDRLFTFQAAQGSAAGRYFIRFARDTSWGVNVNLISLKLDARSAADHFELKHVGNGRWKIYQKSGMVVCLEKNSSANGVKLVVRPDRNGPDTEWVFFDLATLRSFIPAVQQSSTTATQQSKSMEEVLAKHYMGRDQYFSRVSASQFAADNADGKFKTVMEEHTPGDQWTLFAEIIRGLKRNTDVSARRAVLQTLNSVTPKEGSNFLEKALRGKMGDTIRKDAAAESDATAKALLREIADKF